MLCEYGCGQKAKFKTSNGKWCCSERFNSCPEIRRRNSETNKIKQSGKNNGMYGKKHTIESRIKNSEANRKVWADPNSIFNTRSYRRNLRSSLRIVGRNRRRTIEMLKRKYPLFCKIEKLRYNPEKPGENEIQVKCKNHDCKNWFTPTNIQLYERIRNIEHHGLDNSFYYCSDECKNSCPLFNLRTDPNKDSTKPYTESEYRTFRQFVLERDKFVCQFCGKRATTVHHERPKKLEPFYALDPDYAWSCCEECHYKKGHPTETDCSTGRIANIVCT